MDRPTSNRRDRHQGGCEWTGFDPQRRQRRIQHHCRGAQSSQNLSGNAKKGAADVHAVDNVDLKVREGELVVLLGPSGCGKTTLLRSIAGLERPDSGEVRITGRVVYSSKDSVYVPPEDRRIGMMFQSYALWPHMTVFQNVAYPLTSLKGYDRIASAPACSTCCKNSASAGSIIVFPAS